MLQATPADGAKGVFLNERVELYFSDRIDPATVHPASARIVDGNGRAARGRWEVRGTQLTFQPEPVRARNLADGGYRPGTDYALELSGFPRPDGLCSEEGALLGRTITLRFRTVDVSESGRGFVFEDSSLDVGLPLVLRTPAVAVGEGLLLEGEEPIDPATLFDDDFELLPMVGAIPRKRVPLRATLISNFDRRAPGTLGTTQIELLPREPLVAQEGTRYLLRMRPNSRLRDFGGHPVGLISTSASRADRQALIEVRGAREANLDVAFEPFFGVENRSPEIVPDCDGTASWDESGRIELRLPAACGDGRDGAVALAGGMLARGVSAVRCTVARGETLDIGAEPGPVILRAQGSIRLEGALVRSAVGKELDFSNASNLSEWLTIAEQTGVTVTVLVAGGDVELSGPISLEGPLLVVAGGRIRAAAKNFPRCPWVWGAGEGIGGLSFLNLRTDSVQPAVRFPLDIDQPSANRIAQPLTFAVRSGPIPGRGQASRWHPFPRVGGHAGSGAFRVRYVGERSGRGLGESAEQIVDDPVLLSDCPNLRLQIELDLLPGADWDPPWVDFVTLSWDHGEAERAR